MVTYKDIRKSEEIRLFIQKGNANLGALGFTDHSEAHTVLVAERAAEILSKLGYSEYEVELVRIAGYMHDIGNAINRAHHAEYGALLTNDLLRTMGMPTEDRIHVVSAIAHHDESTGGATDIISAALILADKTDVRRNRVRQNDMAAFDIHDRVNYAVLKNELIIDVIKNEIILDLSVDEEICTMYDYFDIFLERMLLSRAAAEKMLGVKFKLRVNGNKVL